MSHAYSGRHRPPTRAERRAAERRLRGPRSFGPGYALPTAAAATLVLSAGGATAAQSSAFGAEAPSAAAALTASSETGGTSSDTDVAREQVATQAADTSALADRRRAASASVAVDQGRAQERQRVARDQQRKELKQRKAKAKAAARTKQAASGSATGSSTSTGVPAGGEQSPVGAQGWVSPIDVVQLTSGYGPRWGRLHAGQDYAAPVGTPLRAMSTGEVIFAGEMQGYGTTVDIRYSDGTVSRYGHMDSISASVGQQVAPGDVVGTSGNTGRSTGPHLHLEIHPGGGEPIDPAPWLASKGLL